MLCPWIMHVAHQIKLLRNLTSYNLTTTIITLRSILQDHQDLKTRQTESYVAVIMASVVMYCTMYVYHPICSL